ncbi:MAG: hypothetical protein A2Y25_04700 [Candidatus Melainabacteria bacterium GWF2_37_15]|nr:MAG: hypothetical protein A2Y25_04700 [Candidatus Melainabacteria bacterium GWF2_37_15]
MENTILNRINCDNRNKELFAPVLGNNYAKTINPTKQDEHDVYTTRWQKYKRDVKDTHSKAFKFTLAGGVTLLLGGAGIVVGRGRIAGIRESIKALKKKESVEKTLSGLDSVKKRLLQGLDMYFSADKIKDFSLLKILNKLSWPGQKLAELSKFSRHFPKRTTNNKLQSLGKELKEKGLKIDAAKVNEDVAQITEIIEKKAKGLADNISRSYFSDLKEGFSNLWGRIKKGDDVVMSEWKEIAKKLEETVDETHIGKAIKVLREKNADDPLVKKYEQAKKFIIDDHGGRIRDLELGAGICEILIPIIAGGILTKNTLKGKTAEEKSDNFVKGGGVGIAGGIGVWLITMARSINGPSGMIIGLLSGIGIDVAGRQIYKHAKKAKNKINEQLTQGA